MTISFFSVLGSAKVRQPAGNSLPSLDIVPTAAPSGAEPCVLLPSLYALVGPMAAMAEAYSGRVFAAPATPRDHN